MKVTLLSVAVPLCGCLLFLADAAVLYDKGKLAVAVDNKNLLQAAKDKLQAGHSREAIDLANKALAAGTYGLEPILVKATAAFQLEDYEQAAKECAHYLALGGESARAFQIRGSAFAKLGKKSDAIDEFSMAIRVAPDNPVLWASRGSLRVGAHQAEQALHDLDMAAKLGRQTPGVYFDRGEALRQLGRNEEAAESYTQGLLLKPGYRGALLERGDLFSCLGKDLDSVKDYSEILRHDPYDQKARLRRAWINAKLGELSASEEDLQWTIRHGNVSVPAYIELAYVLLRMGKHAEAINTNEKALKLLNENDVRLRTLLGYQLGLLFLVEGNLDQAKQQYGAATHSAEEAFDAIAVEVAIWHLENMGKAFNENQENLKRNLLLSLERSHDLVVSKSKQDVQYCLPRYW